METLEIVEQFKKVIIDSLEEKNKIKNLDDYDIYIQLKTIDERIQERFLLEWISYMKFKKPGYVIQDLKIILELGVAGLFGDFVSLDSDILNDWSYKYGIKHISKDIHTSKRNYYLGLAYNDSRNSKNAKISGTSLSELKKKHGADYMKKNFPNIILGLKGKIGKDADVPKTWEEYPKTR